MVSSNQLLTYHCQHSSLANHLNPFQRSDELLHTWLLSMDGLSGPVVPTTTTPVWNATTRPTRQPTRGPFIRCDQLLKMHDANVFIQSSVYTKKFPSDGNWTVVKNLFTPQLCTAHAYRTTLGAECLPGCLTVHDECFNFVIGPSPSREKLNCFGRALVWRSCNPVRFGYTEVRYHVPEPDGFPQALIVTAGKQAGVPMLERLPPEILTLIHSYSRDAALWGLVKVTSLKLRLAAIPCDIPLVSVALATIDSWKRGDISPVLSEVSRPPAFVCITLDSDGIRQIKQLASYPSPLREDGICWVDCPDSHALNTAAPPLCFEGCSMISKGALKCPYFETISVNSSDITGITFYLKRTGFETSVFDIVCHTRAYPQKPVRVLTCDYELPVYLPMPPNDRILWLQVRSSFYSKRETVSITLETKLSGVIHIGPQHTTPFKTLAFSNLPQMMICEFDNGRSHKVLAVYPQGDSPNAMALDDGTRGPHFSPSAKYLEPPTWSWAPLEGIQHVRVFQDKYSHFQGMHITYENGGQRFLGQSPKQCESVDWSKPSRLNIETSPYLNVLYVSFTHDELAPSSTFKQYNLEGELHYYGYGWKPRLRILPSGSWRRADVIV
ncbi:hypothetical protein FSARC_6526 [Fusarium sarcochroum]|uniref:Uncharacterized protein n=1 Tax=Fusarium sarcochroum TaxID=1208366 RepID=A0A8H4X990_9HYPO|nr:hypothetical protein FSARC_6526 [Fusarium sarcochroum]